MTNNLHFSGFIKGVRYIPFLGAKLTEIDLHNFNINEVKSSGIIIKDNYKLGYSKWVSPKRTRSYPFARICNTYNCSKIITVIPIIKDQGKDGDRDMIQYSTISWMNLLNIFIVFGYYDKAIKNTSKKQIAKQKITQ